VIADDSPFVGTQRFEIVRRLGAGGMGVVYEALDRDQGAHVALKTLRSFDARTILLFKREFRALEGLHHPNLVQLGELVEEHGRWFFTMELVRGVDFLSHVRPLGFKAEDESTSAGARPPAGHAPSRAGRAESAATAVVDEGRLRAALAQLARGLLVLHASEKVHRDIKPSNILVTPAGRVVLLDFGLVTETASHPPASDDVLLGTVGYMAPEQAGFGGIGPPADWYSVGVLLYFALTGRLPFDGVAADVLMKKQREAPPPPSAVSARTLSADLEALCVDLLRIDPKARPAGPEVLRRLAAGSDRAHVVSATTTARGAFVGRTAELDWLSAAFEEARASGATVAVRVLGESGVGKTALVRRFAGMASAQGALVLAGRCYERELVPFKAVDGVVDALSLHLARLPIDAAAALAPPAAGLLPQLFPVLGRIEPIASGGAAGRASLEPREMRARSFAALRELFVNVARSQPLLVAIDDLQWADADSLALLAEIVRPPEAPRMLLVCTARVDAPEARLALPFATRDLQLAPLPPEEARELAAELLARARTPTVRSPDAIAGEAGGHPLFIAELARHAHRSPHGEVRFDEALFDRVSSLDERARRMVELVAVAGAPVRLATAARALGEDDRARLASCLSLLRAESLVRTARGGGADRVEAYHDRMREAVLARLDEATRRGWHERIALTLESEQGADAEALAVHWRGAGAPDKAARWALAAAREAGRSLAFERAATLGRMALSLVAADHADAQRARVLVADALANAGRGPEAAALYLAAADRATAGERLELRRRAAEQLLRSGHIDEGLDAIAEVLDAVGLRLPRTPRGAVASLVWNKGLLAVRGERFALRAADEIDPFALRRVDACWSVTLGLSLVDVVRAADFQARTLRFALEAGEPARLARSFAMAACFCASDRRAVAERAPRLIKQAELLAEGRHDPYALAWLPLARAYGAFCEGRWRDALEAFDAAHARFTTCTNVTWELASAEASALYALGFLGELRELGRRVERAYRDATHRGDLFAAMNVRTGSSHYVRLAADDPDASRRESSEALQSWSRRGFHMQHMLDLFTQTETDLYLGDGRAALARLRARWNEVVRSRLLFAAPNRIIMVDLFARAELAAARTHTGSTRRALGASVEHRARELEAEGVPWARAMAALLRAGAAAAERPGARAAELYARAAEAMRAAEMPLHGAAATLCAAGLLGAEQDRAESERARARFVEQGVRAPERFAAMLAP
jgi:hypothetical protein